MATGKKGAFNEHAPKSKNSEQTLSSDDDLLYGFLAYPIRSFAD
jgi:hypothetical protein